MNENAWFKAGGGPRHTHCGKDERGEGGALDGAAELLHELYGGGGGAAGGQQIVADDDAVASLHGVLVDFQSIGAVFEGIGDAGCFGGQLFGFADRYETRAETISQR